jgi:hypothetical protein
MPDTIERLDVRLLTPEVQAIGERLLEAARLTIERAVAEQRAPGQTPFPRDRQTLEATLLRRLKERPAPAQARAKRWLDEQHTKTRHPSLRTIDLASPESVLQQVARLEPAATLTLEILQREGAPKPLSGPGGGALPDVAFTTLALRVHRLKCHGLTSGSGNDEITLAGSGVTATGKTAQAATLFNETPFDHDGQVRSFSPPREFVNFRFADDDTVTVDGSTLPVAWPRTYLVTFMLAEIDNGGFPDFVKDIVDKLKDAGVAEIKAAIAGAVGGIGGPLGSVIASALTWVAAKLTDWLITNVTALIVMVWEDDPFPPTVSRMELASPIDPFSGKHTSDERHWNLKGHGGHYEVFFDWHLEGKQIATPDLAAVLSPGVVAWRPRTDVRPQRIDVFMRGKDRGAYNVAERPEGWSGWGEIPSTDATFLSAPAAVSWAPGRLELFALGDDARIYQHSKNGDDWSAWGLHMGAMTGDRKFKFGPASVSRQANWVDVFATTVDGRIVHAFWNGQKWSEWLEDLPVGTFLSGPAATSRGNDRLDVFALGEDRHIYISSWRNDASGWSGWAKIPAGTFTSAPAACDWSDERLDVFARGDDRRIYHCTWNGQKWSPWAPDPGAGTFRSGPAAVSRQAGLIDLFAVGDDQRMWRSRFDGTSWSGWVDDMGTGTFA